MTLKPVKLQDAGSRRGKTAKVYRSQPVGRFTRDNFGALEPARLAAIIAEARRGYLEDFADLWSYAIRTDPTLRSLYITRISAVAGADVEVLPGPHREGEEGMAEAAASFVREALERIGEWEDRFGDLLAGTFTNVGVIENCWRPERDTVWGDFAPVLTRDLEYHGDWELFVRTYSDDEGNPTNAYQCVSLREHPNKFTVNTPRNISERPTLTGEAYACLWPWLFKRWVEKDGLDGFGRMANGLLWGAVDENADLNVINERLEQLENLATNGCAVFPLSPGAQLPVNLLEPSRDPGSTYKTLVDYYNAELAKAVLGSGLNVEVGTTGGNRALGESQFSTTILPRLQADAKRALGAVRRDFLRPLLGFNRHKFGGRMPPVPYLQATIVSEEQTPISPEAVQAGAVTVDELRGASGLDPWGPEGGGDRVVQPLAKVQPGFSHEPPGGAAPPAPFLTAARRRKPHQLKLRLDTKSSPTPTTSPTPLSRALSRPSDDPEH